MGKTKKPLPQSNIGLADALFSSTQQRVLALLFGQPDRRFFTAEIIALAGKGSGAVQRELAALTESGLITTTLVSKLKFYQANRKSPIFQELQSIVVKTIGLASPLKKALEKLKNIRHAFIFGSFAKGSDRASSDIDLFVVAEGLTLSEIYDLVTPVEQQLARPINCTLYTPREFEKKIAEKNPFVLKVLQGETLPLIGDHDAILRQVEKPS